MMVVMTTFSVLLSVWSKKTQNVIKRSTNTQVHYRAHLGNSKLCHLYLVWVRFSKYFLVAFFISCNARKMQDLLKLFLESNFYNCLNCIIHWAFFFNYAKKTITSCLRIKCTERCSEPTHSKKLLSSPFLLNMYMHIHILPYTGKQNFQICFAARLTSLQVPSCSLKNDLTKIK